MADSLIEVFIKDLCGRTHVVRLLLSDTVATLKQLVAELLGMMPSRTVLLYAGQSIHKEEHKTMRDLDIDHGSTVHVLIGLRGGGCEQPRGTQEEFKFADITNPDTEGARGHFAQQAPNWRALGHGLGLQGVCKHRGCDAYNARVLNTVAKIKTGTKATVSFELEKDTTFKCPECGHAVKPDGSLLFSTCKFMAIGAQPDGKVSQSTYWRKAPAGGYTEFDPANDATKTMEATWTSLTVLVKAL